MIKVLKVGTWPAIDHKYEVTCYRCKTEFEYNSSDALTRDQREGSTVECPTCQAWLTHDTKNVVSVEKERRRKGLCPYCGNHPDSPACQKNHP